MEEFLKVENILCKSLQQKCGGTNPKIRTLETTEDKKSLVIERDIIQRNDKEKLSLSDDYTFEIPNHLNIDL